MSRNSDTRVREVLMGIILQRNEASSNIYRRKIKVKDVIFNSWSTKIRYDKYVYACDIIMRCTLMCI